MRRFNFGRLLGFALFISFACGIIIGNFFSNFVLFLVLSLLFAISGYFFYRRNQLFISDIFILLFFLSLGGLWQLSAPKKIDRFLNKESNVILKVISLPQSKGLRNTFKAKILQVNSRPSKFHATVMDYTRKMDYLSKYQLKAKLTKTRYNSRSWSYLWVKSNTDIQKLETGFWTRIAKKLNSYILGVFKANCDGEAYRFLSAVFLGRRELLKNEKYVFSNAGVSHLLAISGLHLGLTSLILFFSLRLFNLKFRLCLISSLLFLYFYTFLTGASPSTIRAVIMYSVFAVSFLMKRKSDNLNSLGLAGLVILFIDPETIFHIGFQLSFISVLAIILGFRIFNISYVNNYFLNYIKQIFFCSFFVSISIAPLISHYFGKIYILSIFYNIVLIPFFTFILGVNFLLIIFSPLSFAAQSLGAVLSLLISIFIKLTKTLGSLRYSFIPCTFSSSAMFIYYALLGAILLILFSRRGNGFLANSKKQKV